MPPGLRESKMRDVAEIMRNSSPTTSTSHVVSENWASRGTTPCHFTRFREKREVETWGQVMEFDARCRLPEDADVRPEAPEEFSDMLTIDGKNYLVLAVRGSSNRGRSFKIALLQARGGA